VSATTEPASTARADQPGQPPAPHRHAHHEPRRGLAVGVRVALILLLLIGSGGIAGFLISTKASSKTRAEPLPPVTVRTVRSAPRQVDRQWEGYGTVRSMNRAQIAAEVSGRVIERPAGVEAGLPIARGGLLLALDAFDYQETLARAEQAAASLRAQLDGLAVESERLATQVELIDEEIAAAERDMDRTRQAIEQGAGSPGELDAKLSALRRSQRERDAIRQQVELLPSRRAGIQAELAAREADRRLASQNLGRARVTSPIEGQIQDVVPRVGDWVPAGSAVASVVDLSRVEVPLRLPASSNAWVKPGDAVSLWTDEAAGTPAHTGRVVRLAPEADAASRTITVFVEVQQDPASPTRLLPGAFVHARVRTPDPVARVVLPRRAVRAGRIMVVEPDAEGQHRVRVVTVRVDYAIDGRLPEIEPVETEWVVLDPDTVPPPDARIAVTSLETLEPGVRVRLSEEADPARAEPTDGGEG
jgi:multidrug efflux pump subunit AcrA (membrane-fusion protein)